MTRTAALAILLAGCASTAPPPPLSVPPAHLLRPAPHPPAGISDDAQAARSAADRYIFSKRSTADGIHAVRHLLGLMQTAVERMRHHPSPANVALAKASITALQDYLGTVR